jgi:hypothetical protein
MGSNGGESDEKPLHDVTLGSFMMSKYEVTQELWESVMGNNPSNFKGNKRPVEKVSWFDAVEFCNRLSEKEGLQKHTREVEAVYPVISPLKVTDSQLRQNGNLRPEEETKVRVTNIVEAMILMLLPFTMVTQEVRRMK